MSTQTHARPASLRLLRAVIFVTLTASVLWAAIATFHWPIVGDSPLLHYNVFLHDHGMAPYRTVVDMNLPGTYALEWTAIHLLGPGPIAWRIFDYLLLTLIGLCMILIARRLSPDRDSLPGFFAACLFALIHFRDGPTHTGQRDLMMSAMLLPATLLLLYATRERSFPFLNRHPSPSLNCHPSPQAEDPLLTGADPTTNPGAPGPASGTRASANPTTPILYPLSPIPYLLCGLFLGMATIIKPSGIFFALTFFTLLWIHLGELHRPRIAALAFTKLGFLIPLAGVAIYLIHAHAFAAFFTTLRGLDAYHASLGRPSLIALIFGSIPSVLLVTELTALPLFLTEKPWRTFPGKLLLSGALLGCLSYILQGKGYPYHRYPTEAFLLLLLSLLVFPFLTATNWKRIPTIFCVVLSALYLAPTSAAIAVHYDAHQEFNDLLATDLNALGGPALSHNIQCIDTTAGCVSTLYNLQLVQSTGYLYHCYIFQPAPSPYQDTIRAKFWSDLQATHPKVIVISDQECFTFNRTFGYLSRWPQFNNLLATDYTQIIQRTPPHTVGWWRHPNEPFSYRIYLRKPDAQH